MKRTEIVPTLERLFTDPPFTISNTYKVCWCECKLSLLSTTCPRKADIVFGIFHKSELRDGLRTEDWQRLEAKILSFLTQKGLL